MLAARTGKRGEASATYRKMEKSTLAAVQNLVKA
jgi:hypothetical protein